MRTPSNKNYCVQALFFHKKLEKKKNCPIFAKQKYKCMVKSLRNTIKTLLIVSCLLVPTAVSAQDVQHSQIEMEQQQITVNVSDATLRVKNADGLVVEIFSLTGEKVFSQRIESSSKAIELSHLQRGFYIVKIGKYTRKIYLR